MILNRPFLIALLVSLGFGFFIFCLALFPVLDISPWKTGEGRKAWAILRCPVEIPDREIGEKLISGGIDFVSESTQWVLFNDFGELLKLPLDRYRDYVEPIDPRDDGYAEKLRAFFIREGERYFFLDKIPKKVLERRLTLVLGPPGEYRWALDYPSRPFPWTSLGAASLAALVFVFFGARHREAFAAFCAVPPLLCLAPAGPGALGPAGILAALFFIFRDALAEWFHRNKGVLNRRRSREGFFEWISLYRSSFIAGCGALALYGILCFFGDIPFPAALWLVPAYAVVLVLSRWAESKQRGNAFVPLPIKPPAGTKALFPPVVPIFSLLFVLALGFTPAAMSAGPGPSPGVLPGPEEYAAHAAFQRAFSFRSLHGSGPYGSYSTGPDGLIAGFTESAPPAAAIPPYPLAMLSGADMNRRYPPFRPGVLISLGIMIVLSFPPIFQTFRDSKKNKILV